MPVEFSSFFYVVLVSFALIGWTLVAAVLLVAHHLKRLVFVLQERNKIARDLHERDFIEGKRFR